MALARALAPGPRLLLADEPTGNLDQATGEQVVEMLFGLLQKSGATLVLVTHEMRLAERSARVIEMMDGRVVGDKLKAVAA